jgi:geranylgeranyl diphosphate synthase type I
MRMGQPRATPEAETRAAFEAFVRDVRPRVESRLTSVLDARAAEASRHGADVGQMASAVRELTLRGGKRLRAALVIAAFRAADGQGDEAAAIDTGVALELLQTYLLIHDDWMDGDLVRRGGPSVHALLRAHFQDDARGDSSAILAGDYTAALALDVLTRLPISPDRSLAVIRRFAAIQVDAVYGQQLDVAARPADVEAMHALKTGSYTVRGPLMLGASLAGASAAQEDVLARFAEPLGVAFQLRDDLLGTFGAAHETGKPFGNDIRAGKRTALVDEAEARLDSAGRSALERAFGRAAASEEDVSQATRALETCGARLAVEQRIDSLVATARAALSAPLSEAGVRLLSGAAASLTSRSS